MPSTTHNLYISDGTETASLVTDDVFLLDYVPQTATRQGGQWQDVTESATVLIQAATTNLIRYRANVIDRLLQQGEDRQNNPAQERVFAYLQLANEDQLWRSEILGGRVEIDADGLRNWNARAVEAVIIWTRRYYWEGEEDEVPLVAASEVAADNDFTELPTIGVDVWGLTGGITLNNRTSNSWWETDIVTGSLPAGVKVQITPSTQEPVHHYYLGHSVGLAGNFDHHYEGEDATGATQLPGSPDANNYSGSYYGRVSVSATSLTAAFTFAVSTLQLSYADGGYFQVLLRYAGTAPTAGKFFLQARIEYAGIELWRGPEVENEGISLESLGVVQLPPSLQNTGFGLLSEVNLVIYARVPSAATNLDLDYMQLIGAQELRFLDPITVITGLATDTAVVDDGIDDGLYFGVEITTDTDDLKVPGFVGLGERLTIVPGVRNRYYLQTSEVGATPTAVTYGVRMWHRPRRLSI